MSTTPKQQINCYEIILSLRPVNIYTFHCWPTTKSNESLLTVMEAKMFHWIFGAIRYDHCQNEDTVIDMELHHRGKIAGDTSLKVWAYNSQKLTCKNWYEHRRE